MLNFWNMLLRGHAVAELIEVLRYKPEVRGFDSIWRLWHNPSNRTKALGSTHPLPEIFGRG
jgi:hypothetical protein